MSLAATVFDQRLSQLAPAIRTKFFDLDDMGDALRDRARAAFSAWEAERDRLAAARTAHQAAVDADKHDPEMVAARRHGTWKPGPRLEATAAALALCEERASHKRNERDRIAQLSADAGAVLDAVTKLLNEEDAAALVPVVVPRPTSSTAADLARIRETLASLDREARTLVGAPRPLDQAHALLDADLDTVAAKYDPVVLPFAMPGQPLPAPGSLVPYDWAPLLASLPPFRDLRHEKLTAAYRTLPASVTDDERVTVGRTLVERRMKLELQEEVLVLAGTGLSRRPDASPRIVLTTLLQA
jgi:hypothetical protein